MLPPYKSVPEDCPGCGMRLGGYRTVRFCRGAVIDYEVCEEERAGAPEWRWAALIPGAPTPMHLEHVHHTCKSCGYTYLTRPRYLSPT